MTPEGEGELSARAEQLGSSSSSNFDLLNTTSRAYGRKRKPKQGRAFRRRQDLRLKMSLMLWKRKVDPVETLSVQVSK